MHNHFEINRETITIRFIDDMKMKDYKDLLNMYHNSNKSVLDIMIHFNITKSAVYKILKDNNYVRRLKKFDKVQEIIRIYQDNTCTHVELAKMFNTSTRMLARILKENNVPKRIDLRYGK